MKTWRRLCLAGLLAGPARTAAGTVWLRGVVHVHSDLSHDSRGTFPQIAAAARAAGVSFVLLTDHPGGGAPDWQPAGVRDGVLFVPGLETGHLLALGVTRSLTGANPASLIRQIHAQGGLAIAAHAPDFRAWEVPGLDGMEVYDLPDDVRDEFLPWAAARWLWARRHGPLPALATVLDAPRANLARWDARNARGPFTGLAGVDAHQNFGVARWRLDAYADLFAFVQTWVEADRSDARAVLAALRRGRSMIVFTVFGDPGPVRFSATDGRTVARPGDILHPAGAVRLTAALPPRATLRLIRDGARILESRIALDLAAPGPGAYRVEILTAAGRPWVYTSPLWIAAPGRAP